MSSVYFRSLYDADVVDVGLLKLDGEVRSHRLLVDSGFTGSSGLVLPLAAADLIRAALPAKRITGALQGMHERGWVAVRVAGLDFQSTMIAIFTDTTPLALPPGVAGLAGLTFLRQFASWGGQLTPNGWQFLLSDGRD